LIYNNKSCSINTFYFHLISIKSIKISLKYLSLEPVPLMLVAPSLADAAQVVPACRPTYSSC
jgi:hypothetical protein